MKKRRSQHPNEKATREGDGTPVPTKKKGRRNRQLAGGGKKRGRDTCSFSNSEHGFRWNEQEKKKTWELSSKKGMGPWPKSPEVGARPRCGGAADEDKKSDNLVSRRRGKGKKFRGKEVCRSSNGGWGRGSRRFKTEWMPTRRKGNV